MKKVFSILTFVLLAYPVFVTAQIKLHSSEGISIGSTIDPGSEKISLDYPTVATED